MPASKITAFMLFCCLFIVQACSTSEQDNKVTSSLSASDTEMADELKGFSSENELYSRLIFDSTYRIGRMEQVDNYPTFETAIQSLHKRYISSKAYTSDKVNGTLYPRVTWRAFSFNDSAAALQAVRKWVNSFEGIEESYKWGQEVENVKATPFLCAITHTNVYLLQVSCLYEGLALEKLSQKFIELFSSKKATYIFSINCRPKGQLQFHHPVQNL